MGLICGILEDKEIGNCSNGGISARFSRVCVVNAEGPFDPADDLPAVRIEQNKCGHWGGPVAYPEDTGEGVGPMFGGTFITTSDGRLGELLRKLGYKHVRAVPLHDRWESAELNEALSR